MSAADEGEEGQEEEEEEQEEEGEGEEQDQNPIPADERTCLPCVRMCERVRVCCYLGCVSSLACA